MNRTPEEQEQNMNKLISDKTEQIEEARITAMQAIHEANVMRAAIEEALFQATLIEALYIDQVTEPLEKALAAIDKKKNKEIKTSEFPKVIRFSLEDIQGKTGTYNPYENTIGQKRSTE